MASSESQKHQLLTATYNSPTNEPFTFTHKLPAPLTTSTADKTSYLAALRKATVVLQDSINKDLTSRMEEDKAREAPTSGNAKAKGVDEAKEEDNYGEEVVEEDD